MVQNIRPPHDPVVLSPPQPVNNAKPVHDRDSRTEADLKASTSAPTQEQVEQAAARIKEVLRGTTSRLEIEIDSDLHRAVIKVFNGESGEIAQGESGEIIRQIPSQELLDLAKHLNGPKGLLVREHA